MPSRYKLRLSCASTGFVALLAVGCSAPPPARQTTRVRDLESPAARREAAQLFWRRADVPDLRGHGYRRIAIAEFVVEFVTAKRELTADLEEYFRQNPGVQRPGGAVQNVEVVYPNEYDYPATLYQLCCDDLKQRGFEVVPAAEVARAAAYQRFEVEPEDKTVELKDTDVGPSDTGRVRRLSLRSLPGLSIIRGAGDQAFEAAAEALRRELHADVVLCVRVRAGTFSGHATLERGSRVRVVAPDVAGTLSAERSLVSEEWVVAESRAVLGGWQLRVNLPKYQRAVAALFPVYIAMAFDSAESAPHAAAGGP
ncbi:MAG: hypothetical protein AB1716_13125 [Planctomycetota bacterium]